MKKNKERLKETIYISHEKKPNQTLKETYTLERDERTVYKTQQLANLFFR